MDSDWADDNLFPLSPPSASSGGEAIGYSGGETPLSPQSLSSQASSQPTLKRKHGELDSASQEFPEIQQVTSPPSATKKRKVVEQQREEERRAKLKEKLEKKKGKKKPVVKRKLSDLLM